MRAASSHYRVTIAIVLAASVALSACGRKGPPEAPVTTAPAAQAEAAAP